MVGNPSADDGEDEKSEINSDKLFVKGTKRMENKVIVDLAYRVNSKDRSVDLEGKVERFFEDKDIEADVERLPLTKTKVEISSDSMQELLQFFEFMEGLRDANEKFSMYERVNTNGKKHLKLELRLLYGLKDVIDDILGLFQNEELLLTVDFPRYEIGGEIEEKFLEKGFDIPENYCFPEKKVKKDEVLPLVKYFVEKLEKTRKIYLDGEETSVIFYTNYHFLTIESEDLEEVKRELKD